ncbi:MAG TPA: hypothetical protein VEJ16_15660 [Alphaproteobacteria bacterium]|nr:hypothetical protein [Alphaproteobacteria bacterium]
MTQLATTCWRRLPFGTMAAALIMVTMFAVVQVPSTRAEDFDHGHDRGHDRDRDHGRVVVRHDRDIHVVPRVVYAPPPVVYAPPPPTEGINVIFPLHIR